jgi:hypothetical protein
LQEEPIVLHVEFQLKYDKEMGERLWQYNALTRIHTKLPVYSVVIYLLEHKQQVESPYVIRLPGGRPTQQLDFDTIKLWELEPEIFEQQELVGLLPLLPLTKDGKNRETVERMIDGLEKAGRQDLFMVGYAISDLVLTTVGDNEWLKARFFMSHDILKDTWVFQQVIKEGLEQGLIQFVEIRFPTLLTLAKWVVEQKMSLEQLREKLNMLYKANTIEEAQAALLAK